MEKEYPDIVHDFIVTDIGGSGEATRIKECFYDKYDIMNISTFSLKDVPVLYKRLRNSKAYDNIIFHSLYLNYLLIALLLNMKVVRRATFIIWGVQDGGPFVVPETKRRYRAFGWLYEKLRSVVIPEFKYIGTMIEADYDKATALYKVKGARKKSGYILGTFDDPGITDKKNKNRINVQVGHAGYKLTCVIEALEVLSKFKDEHIRIYSPLSYGDDLYIKEVIKRGKEIFGSKFYPITRQMSGENFAKFISSMDVFVHNAPGQMGLANVDTHLLFKNKIYLNDNGVVYNDYGTKQGYHVSKVSDIQSRSFEDFVYYSPGEAEENKTKFSSMLDVDNLRAIWDNILLDLTV